MTELGRRLMYLPENVNPFSAHIWSALRNHQVPRAAWSERLAFWLGTTQERARALLAGTNPSSDEVERASRHLNIEATELMYGRPSLVESDVISDNIDFLVTNCFGSAKEVAALLNTSEETVSRWRNGKHKPRPDHIAKLREAAGIDQEVDLFQTPLALLRAPVISSAKRRWLIERIELLDSDVLDQLYPALERMLKP